MESSPSARAQTWYHPLAAIVMIVCDFTGLAGDILWMFWALSIAGVFLVSFTLVFFIQYVLDQNSWRIALLKALIAGTLCAIPMPIFGTVAGSMILVKSGLNGEGIPIWRKKNPPLPKA